MIKTCFKKFTKPAVEILKRKEVSLLQLMQIHYSDVIMSAMVLQIASLTIVYSTVYSDAGKRKHQSSASLGFVRRIHWWPVNSPHKWAVTRKMSKFDDVIMLCIWDGKTNGIPVDGLVIA